MNGPQHYREAERWLDLAKSIPDLPVGLNAFAAAQVHATLALAAATAETVVGDEPRTMAGQLWATAVD